MRFKNYEIAWCEVCDRPAIYCKECKNSSCCNKSCDICAADFEEFLEQERLGEFWYKKVLEC